MSLKSLALKLSVPLFLAAATATTGAFAAGPYDRDHRDVSVNVYVRKAPPPVRYERPYSAWSYDRAGYYGNHSAYRAYPPPRAYWRGGHWEHRPQGWVYFGSTWR